MIINRWTKSLLAYNDCMDSLNLIACILQMQWQIDNASEAFYRKFLHDVQQFVSACQQISRNAFDNNNKQTHTH